MVSVPERLHAVRHAEARAGDPGERQAGASPVAHSRTLGPAAQAPHASHRLRLKPQPEAANAVWCMDFAEDRIMTDRKFYTLLIKDEASAFCVAAPVSLLFKGADVVRLLDEAAARYGKLAFVRCDDGGQFISHAVRRWAERRGIRLAYIDPGSPWQNGAAESLGATSRREVPDAELFHSLLETHVLTERWRRLYNERRPHSRLGHRATDHCLPPRPGGHRIAS